MTTTHSYRTTTVNSRRWVWHGDTLLGAVTVNPWRAYVHPFYAPCGVCVVQECGADHVHHQGIMVGQDAINGHNFWAMMHPRYPRNRQELVAESVAISEAGVTFHLTLDWVTADDSAILREERIIRLAHHATCHEAFVQSKLIAAHGPLEFGVTKEGGIGMRVHPLLETEMGGRITDAVGRHGAEAIFDQEARWIDVSGTIEGQAAGILMAPAATEKPIPWFVRDYGIHLHGPRRHTALQLAEGESTTSAVHFAAHDGGGETATLNALADHLDAAMKSSEA